MPRAKRTLSGESALPAAAPKGVPYGEGERALESQRRTPLPNRQATNAPPTPAPVDAPAGGPQAPPVDPLQAALAMAPPTSALREPTQRPSEALTAGLSATPVPQPNPAYHELKALVRRYPYPDLVSLLARIEAEM